MNERTTELVVAIAKRFIYRVFYEYEDSNKWYITKMGGQSGIPVIE